MFFFPLNLIHYNFVGLTSKLARSTLISPGGIRVNNLQCTSYTCNVSWSVHWGALLFYCLSAAHNVYEDTTCTSMRSALEVHWLTGSKHTALSSLTGWFLYLDNFISWSYPIWRIFLLNNGAYCCLITGLFSLHMNTHETKLRLL